jgi:tRNA(fMet)-specific endonuclease VapC
MILCDTNILIEFYKNNQAIVSELKAIGVAKIGISVVSTGELIYGALNKHELSQILKDLAQLTSFEINGPICQLFLELMSKYSLSHKLTLPDAIIAATAIHNNLPLYTLNIKDFKFIDGLVLYSKI